MHRACTTYHNAHSMHHTCMQYRHTHPSPTFSTRPLPHPLSHGSSLPLFVSFMTSPSLSATSTDPNTLSRNFYSKDQCFRISYSQSLCTCPTFHASTVCLSLDQSLHQWISISVASSVFSRREFVQRNPRNPAPSPKSSERHF